MAKKPTPTAEQKQKAPSAAESAAAEAAAAEAAAAAAAEAAAKTQKNPDNEPAIVALLVTSQVEGFRRAGRAWSKTQTRVEVADLTEQQVIALFDEPMLDVVGVAE